MSDYKEFQGKSLDDAIQAAREYYGVEREKLDIEILNDAKTGIFGLVSVKKACIRVTKVQVADLLDSGLTSMASSDGKVKERKVKSADSTEISKSAKPADELAASDEKPKAALKKTAQKAEGSSKSAIAEKERKTISASNEEIETAKKPATENADKENAAEPIATTAKKASRPSSRDRSASTGDSGKARPAARANSSDTSGESMTELDLSLLNADEFVASVHETVMKLVRPIVGDVTVLVNVQQEGAVKVTVECEESSGLLVGREGQTLAAIQYVAARVISKKYDGAVRLQIDAGNYRERQEEKLKDLAVALAEKARTTGKTQSTRPLSAYQRRIVHLTLEEDNDIHTSSKGDGPQRRVIIQIRKDNGASKTRTEAVDTPLSGAADSAVD